MLAPDPRFERIDSMDGFEFEAQVAELLELLGWTNVERMRRFDRGADIVALRDGIRTAVQVKRRMNAVGVEAVRQLVDGMKHYDCAAGVLVTNHYLTAPARASAATWNIEVWDRETLAEFVDGDEPNIDTSLCAECGAQVKPGVTKFCLDRPARFGGFVYCIPHQARARRS
jgi:HJR/Mrr/RecB family endonuclease